MNMPLHAWPLNTSLTVALKTWDSFHGGTNGGSRSGETRL